MNDLHKAFHVLGLEPGSSFDTIKRRYRRLALVWHPDRMTNADGKKEAEEELKKINNNFDKLKKHFETEHKSGPSCRCQPAADCPPPNSSQSAADNQRTKSQSSSTQTDSQRKRQEEEAARKRSQERQRQMAEEEAARKAAESAKRASERQTAADDAHKEEALRKDEALRWKCAAVIGATFIALIGYCWVGCAVRDIAHGIGKGWQDFQDQFKPKPEPPSQNQPIANPYIEPYEIPGGTELPWRCAR